MHKFEVMSKASLFYFLLFILFNNLCEFFPHINGDNTLVSNVCNKTPYPQDCHTCLDNNTGAPDMTVRELAAEVMYCTYDTSKVLNQRFNELTSKGGAKSSIASTNCTSKIYDFGDKLLGAMTWWYQRGDDVAKKEFYAAKDDYKSCKIALGKLSSPLPSDVDHLFEVINNLYQDSGDIILQSKA